MWGSFALGGFGPRGLCLEAYVRGDFCRMGLPSWGLIFEGLYCDNYRVSGALEKLEHETILQDRASD